jgi:hypothetical protein
MSPRVPTAEVAATRNPVARSLALAVLAVALVAAAIMGAVVFAVLLAVFAVGYLLSLAHAWWRMFRLRSRHRAAFENAPPQPEAVQAIEAEYEVVEATADAAQRGSGGPA